MDHLDDKGTWLASILTGLIGGFGWLVRRHGKTPAVPTTSWLSRRLGVEKDLMIANRTIKTQETEIAYLMAALERTRQTQELVKRAVEESDRRSTRSSSGSMPSDVGSGNGSGANGEAAPTYIGPERRQAERRRNWPPQRTS